MTYQICSNCIMDTSDPHITFDGSGVCNHCHKREELIASLPVESHLRHKILQESVARIKRAARNNEYHCICGISGGVDSSYLLILLKELGLNPLVVHFDNGWNSEVAVRNIERIVKKLDLDLITDVANWPEVSSAQKALFRSGVVDIELLSDQAIIGSLFKYAKIHKIKFILSGHNFSSETHLPASWTWMKFDKRNLIHINRIYGDCELKSLPLLGIFQYIFEQKVIGRKFFWPLNLSDYNKEKAFAQLKSEFGWEEYGGKHGESIITRFYQNYILPKKFGIDKRRSHLSSLVCSKQIDRSRALELIDEDPTNYEHFQDDLLYFKRKLGISDQEFERIMASPPKAHCAFPSEIKVFNLLKSFARMFPGARKANLEV